MMYLSCAKRPRCRHNIVKLSGRDVLDPYVMRLVVDEASGDTVNILSFPKHRRIPSVNFSTRRSSSGPISEDDGVVRAPRDKRSDTGTMTLTDILIVIYLDLISMGPSSVSNRYNISLISN
jgi:hypothetical protein